MIYFDLTCCKSNLSKSKMAPELCTELVFYLSKVSNLWVRKWLVFFFQQKEQTCNLEDGHAFFDLHLMAITAWNVSVGEISSEYKTSSNQYHRFKNAVLEISSENRTSSDQYYCLKCCPWNIKWKQNFSRHFQDFQREIGFPIHFHTKVKTRNLFFLFFIIRAHT